MASRTVVEKEGVETAARIGYAARAVVYATIGVLALMLALGEGGKATGSEGALRALAEQPFGAVLVGIVGLGLLAFAAWRFVQALKDTEQKGNDVKGRLTRAGYGVSGLIHAGLGFYAFRLLQGRGGGGGDGVQSWTARLLSEPFGQVAVVIVGAVIAGFGLAQLRKAWRGNVLDKLSLRGVAERRRPLVERVCRAGIAARAVVFLLMAAFLFRAALEADPGEARGLGETLATLARQPFGPWLLGLVALGLVAFAAYQVMKARYRRIQA